MKIGFYNTLTAKFKNVTITNIDISKNKNVNNDHQFQQVLRILWQLYDIDYRLYTYFIYEK